MRVSSLLLAGVSVISVAAIPSSTHVIHERRLEVPRNWERKHRLDPDVVLPMRIGLTQSNLQKGDHLLMEV